MAQTTYSTPGVYIVEENAFPNSIVAIPTAIPVFIGYTEFATDQNGKPLHGVPTALSSFDDFKVFFGTGFKTKFSITSPIPKPPDKAPDPLPNPPPSELRMRGNSYSISFEQNSRFFLYDSIRMFFNNGGGQCYVVSVGTFTTNGINTQIASADLTGPLDANTGSLLKVMEPTLVVIPDAVGLSKDDCYTVYQSVLMHCGIMQSRMGIFDTIRPDPHANPTDTAIKDFRSGIGTSNLNYGTVYYPWIKTALVREQTEIDFENIDLDKSDPKTFTAIFTEADAATVHKNYTDYADAVNAANATLTTAQAANPQVQADIDTATAALKKALKGDTIDNAKITCHLGLMATSPTYKLIVAEMTNMMNELPPSGALAGIYTFVDNNRGVWKAPANVSINQALAPTVDLNHFETDNLNIDATSGKSVNAIRTFPAIGTLVYGGRTLDGNSQDWRYINVRRTLIMMEQSIKLAARAYVFEPNDATTWVTVKSMIINFLTNLWKEGALAGSAPEEAFVVQVGLGSTMTGNDILDGYMRITIRVAVVHPAEFIVITFQQKMQTS